MKYQLKKSKLTLIFSMFVAFFVAVPSVFANVKQVKVYKEAFPDEKPKCACCHVDEKPKKDDGQHDLNAYGKKVMEGGQTPDAEAYKKAGSNNCAKE